MTDLEPNETSDERPNVTAESDRDELGRWRPGNSASVGKGGAGSRMAEFRRAVLEAITPDELAQVARRLLQDALAGDVTACALLLQRACGQPVPAEPEAQAGVAELLQREYASWMRPAQEVYAEKIANLEAEIDRLRLAAGERPSLAPSPVRQELVPGRIASVGVREVAVEAPALEREPECPARQLSTRGLDPWAEQDPEVRQRRHYQANEARLREHERRYGVALRRPVVELSENEMVWQDDGAPAPAAEPGSEPAEEEGPC